MDFEYDARKSAGNKSKHGIDFVEAQALWDDPDLLEIPARTEDETRFLVVGRIADAHWSRTKRVVSHGSVRKCRKGIPLLELAGFWQDSLPQRRRPFR